jgi:hypothetical protein
MQYLNMQMAVTLIDLLIYGTLVAGVSCLVCYAAIGGVLLTRHIRRAVTSRRVKMGKLMKPRRTMGASLMRTPSAA